MTLQLINNFRQNYQGNELDLLVAMVTTKKLQNHQWLLFVIMKSQTATLVGDVSQQSSILYIAICFSRL